MSNSVAPKLREIAKRLLAEEAALGKRVGADESAAFGVYERLRQPLGKLLGVAGFRALFSRALALASGEVTWLRSLQIKCDGSLEDLADLKAKMDEFDIAWGEIILLARLLELLVTFIGPALTLRLLQDAWPKADFSDLDFAKGEQS